MAKDDVTKEYVDLISYGKYATRTADTAEFEAVKDLQAEYLNTNTDWLPAQKYDRGLALLVCHYYAIDDTVAPDEGGLDDYSGLLTTEKVGDLTKVRSLPYMTMINGSKQYLMLTRYGTEFLYLMRTYKSSIFTT